MKTKKPVLKVVTVALALIATGSWAGVIIPDGNPVGITQTFTESGLGTSISGVTLNLNISGGNNGDLYAYLSYDGVLVNLLNRPGVTTGNPLGYTDPGFNVTLSDGGYANINSYGGNGGAQLTGTYNAAGGSAAFGAFNTLNPNGTWTLFVADLSGGDGSNVSTLNGWTLGITAVPETVNLALLVFGGVVTAAGCAARRAKVPCLPLFP